MDPVDGDDAARVADKVDADRNVDAIAVSPAIGALGCEQGNVLGRGHGPRRRGSMSARTMLFSFIASRRASLARMSAI